MEEERKRLAGAQLGKALLMPRRWKEKEKVEEEKEETEGRERERAPSNCTDKAGVVVVAVVAAVPNKGSRPARPVRIISAQIVAAGIRYIQ